MNNTPKPSSRFSAQQVEHTAPAPDVEGRGDLVGEQVVGLGGGRASATLALAAGELAGTVAGGLARGPTVEQLGRAGTLAVASA